MFDESIPFLSAENARPPSGSRSTINPNYATQKPRASQKRTGYRPTEISKVKRARSCRACSVALRWQGAANIYTQHMHAVHGHGRRAAAARRTARVARAARDRRRETRQYSGRGGDSALTRRVALGTCAARWAATCVRARRAQVSVRGQSRQPGRPGADAARAMHARCPRPMQGQCMHAGGRRSSFGSGPLSAPRPARSHAWRRHQARLAVA